MSESLPSKECICPEASIGFNLHCRSCHPEERLSERPQSKEQVDHSLEDLETLSDYAYDNGFHELGYCPVKTVKAEIDRLQQDNARYENGRVVLLGEIDTLKQKLTAAEQLAVRQGNEIRKLRAGERA